MQNLGPHSKPPESESTFLTRFPGDSLCTRTSEKCCYGLHTVGAWYEDNHHWPTLSAVLLFLSSPYGRGQQRPARFENKQTSGPVGIGRPASREISNHSGINVLTHGTTPKGVFQDTGAEVLIITGFKCFLVVILENLFFLKSTVYMKNTVRKIPLSIRYSVTLTITLNQCLPSRGPWLEHSCQRGKSTRRRMVQCGRLHCHPTEPPRLQDGAYEPRNSFSG